MSEIGHKDYITTTSNGVKKILIICFAFLLVFGFFLFWSNPAEAHNLACSDSWTEYACEDNTSCGGKISQRNAQEFCDSWHEDSYDYDCSYCEAYDEISEECINWVEQTCTATETNCGSCGVNYTDLNPIAGGEYQKCEGPTSWTTTMPSFRCSGACYPAPELKSLDDASLLPKNVADGSKYKLPMNFGWEDNVETEVAKPPNFCPVNSYELNIAEPSLFEIVPNTPYNQLATTSDQSYKLECQLKSNNAYQWKVRACFDADGTDCGDWSEPQGFETNPAPEPIAPYDSDWEGENLAENVRPFIDWCTVEEAGSYFLEIYKEEKEGKELFLPLRIIAPSSSYDDDLNWQELKRNVSYWWQAKWCLGRDTPKEDCSPFSQFWAFIVGEELTIPTNLSPKDGSAVNLLTILSWLGSRYAAGYLVDIQNSDIHATSTVPRVEEGKFYLPLKEIWEEWLELDTPYSWKVASCEWEEIEDEDENKLVCEQWSETITFHTTGAPPTNISFEPENETGEIGFPLTVSWDDVPGAASYMFEAPGIEPRKLNKAETTLSFATNFKQGSTSTISVKTCADEEGEICGNPAVAQFTVAILKPPVITKPEAGTTELIPSLKAEWEKVFGANAYEYRLLYTAADPGETAACQARVGSATEGTTPHLSAVIAARCKGQYFLQIRGCIDKACEEKLGKGQWGAVAFTVKEHPQAKVGLIPCGQPANNPATDPHWDERDPCEIKHLFLLVKIIIDFILFRVAPLILVLLTLYSGIIFYFSLGKAAALARVISLWKAVGIGLLVMFFAWMIVNFILAMAGFQVDIFGRWYEF